MVIDYGRLRPGVCCSAMQTPDNHENTIRKLKVYIVLFCDKINVQH